MPLLDELFPQFASRLIRNGATIGGNLGTASPIGDVPPALLALDARAGAGLASTGSARSRWPTTSPATARRVRRPGRADPARPDPAAAGRGRPRSTRSPSAASTTSPASRSPSRSTSRDGIVAAARIGLGGVAATPIRAHATEAALTGGRGRGTTVRGRGRGAGRRGHADRRSPRQRGLPRARCCGNALRKLYAAASGRGGAGMSSHCSPSARSTRGRPRDPARERGAARHRRGALHRRPGRPHHRTCCTPGRCRRRTPTRGSPAASRRRRTTCPAWSGCSPPTTCPASTTPASSTTSRCSPTR